METYTIPASKDLHFPPDVDGNKVIIKDVIVADPSLEFTIELLQAHFPKKDGYFVKNLEIKILLSNPIKEKEPITFTEIGLVSVKLVSQIELYFAVPFGDSTYKAGLQFKLMLVISGESVVDGKEIPFNDKDGVFELDVFGTGIVRKDL